MEKSSMILRKKWNEKSTATAENSFTKKIEEESMM
jgi:hypothetical protein